MKVRTCHNELKIRIFDHLNNLGFEERPYTEKELSERGSIKIFGKDQFEIDVSRCLTWYEILIYQPLLNDKHKLEIIETENDIFKIKNALEILNSNV